MKKHLKKAVHAVKKPNYVLLFSKRHDLVFFGDVGAKDEIQTPKGFTYSAKAVDSSYAHGNLQGFELSVLIRQSSRGSAKTTVVRVYLTRSELPHFLSFSNELPLDFQNAALSSDSNLHDYQLVGLNNSRRFIGQPQAVVDFNQRVAVAVPQIMNLPPQVSLEIKDSDLILADHRPLSSVNQLEELVGSALTLASALEEVNE